MAMKACPYRADFYAKLSGSEPERAKQQYIEWISALEVVVAHLTAFYAKGDYGRGL